MTLQDSRHHGRLAARRTRKAMASVTVLWIVVFLCAALIATTIGESAENARIEAQIQATRAQNAALEQDIASTQQSLNIAHSPAEIERIARSWGYQRPGDPPPAWEIPVTAPSPTPSVAPR
jgi:type II secretory pathway pseudopilin PulG